MNSGSFGFTGRYESQSHNPTTRDVRDDSETVPPGSITRTGKSDETSFDGSISHHIAPPRIPRSGDSQPDIGSVWGT